MIISFSGLDGAGKTTLIRALKKSLEERNHRVKILIMYDDIVFYSFFRILRDYIKKVLGIQKKKNFTQLNNRSSSKKNYINNRDPKTSIEDKQGFFVKLIYLIIRSRFLKRCVLFLDLTSLLIFIIYEDKLRRRVLIIDRYMYDFLADVADLKENKWFFIKFFLYITPVPDLPIFVDVRPHEAFRRKNEYPISYMEWRRTIYQKIFQRINNALILENNDLKLTTHILTTEVLKRISS